MEVTDLRSCRMPYFWKDRRLIFGDAAVELWRWGRSGCIILAHWEPDYYVQANIAILFFPQAPPPSNASLEVHLYISQGIHPLSISSSIPLIEIHTIPPTLLILLKLKIIRTQPKRLQNPIAQLFQFPHHIRHLPILRLIQHARQFS